MKCSKYKFVCVLITLILRDQIVTSTLENEFVAEDIQSQLLRLREDIVSINENEICSI